MDSNETTGSGDYLYREATGAVSIKMTNDYLFRALMQMNEKVRKALVGALLHLETDEILSAEITNPVELGAQVEDKDFYLDVKVSLNSNSLVDLEMQVINEGNWRERSMLYLCRTFDNVNKGKDYLTVLPAVHIGLLDFTLFQDRPEFYASYMLMNTRSHRLFSDKLRLNVLELNESALATEEDKQWKLDTWAKFFKAETWEGIRMLAQEEPIINDAAETVYKISQDEQIRLRCEAREEYYRIQRTRELREQMLKEQLSQKNKELEEKDQELTEQSKELAGKNKELAGKNKELAGKNKELAGKNKELAEKDRELTEKGQQLAEQSKELAEKDQRLEEQSERIKKLEEMLALTGKPDR